MKSLAFAFGLLLFSPQTYLSPAQRLAKKLIILEQTRNCYSPRQGILRGVKSEGKYYYVLLSCKAGPKTPVDDYIEGYNNLEIIVSEDKLPNDWPEKPDDIKGKTMMLMGDFGLGDQRLEVALTFKNDVLEEHFFFQKREPQSMDIYNHWHGQYMHALGVLMKTLTY